jgi:hypothetical protein
MTDETARASAPDDCRHDVSFVKSVPLNAVTADALDLLARETPPNLAPISS